MLLYMIRHGESEGNISGVVGGCRSIIGLTERGIEDAKKAGEKISEIKFDRVYSSTLKRAIQTCKTALCGCEPILVENLREGDTGILDGRPISECIEQYGEAYLRANKENDAKAFGGESRQEIKERVRRFLELLEKEPCENVAAFTHEGIIRRMYEIVTDNLECTERRWQNGAVCVFLYDGEKWSLKEENL